MISRHLHGTYWERKLRKRLLREKPRALADAPEGEVVCVHGIVRALAEPTPAPLSGLPCVYHMTRVALAIGNRIWLRGHAHTSGGVPFLLEQDGQCAVVDPRQASVSVRFDHVTRSAAAFDADPRQRELLELEPIESWFEIDSVHYYEGLLQPGSRIAVLGTAAREPDPDAREAGGYREAPTRPRFAGSFAICVVD